LSSKCFIWWKIPKAISFSSCL